MYRVALDRALFPAQLDTPFRAMTVRHLRGERVAVFAHNIPEWILLEHPEVAEAAVVGVQDEKWGEVVACFMRARGESRPSPAELKAFMRERLSPQKTPTYWIWVDAWPLTGSGKIRKIDLRERFAEGGYQVLTA